MPRSAQGPQKTWLVIDIIHWAETYFKKKGFDNPRSEIEWLLRSLLQCKRMDVYLRFEEPLSNSQLSILRGWVQRRIAHEPLQYITGSTEFYGREFDVSPAVLIPRPETEKLVEIALDKIPQTTEMTVLDIGTGSGCIGLSLAAERPNAHVVGVDISDDVLDVAKKNSLKHNVKNIRFQICDILNDSPSFPLDIIVCNPPYIPKAEMESLMPDVKNFEPKNALTDDLDGLTFYKRLAEKAPEWINNKGWMILEVGLNDHPENVKALFNCDYVESLEIIQDYNGDDRIMVIKISSKI